jgi:hypothetical protein
MKRLGTWSYVFFLVAVITIFNTTWMLFTTLLTLPVRVWEELKIIELIEEDENLST